MRLAQADLGQLACFVTALLIAAHVLGRAFERLRQPRVIGEILAGVVLGPELLGRYWGIHPSGSAPGLAYPLDLIYWAGLLLLMFLSGAETQELCRRGDWGRVRWLTLFGTGLPFAAAVLCAGLFDLQALAGPRGGRAALVLVIGIAASVTSIPVISRIFHDMRILHTRFAKLVLGVAVIEDIILWAILSIATSLARVGEAGESLSVAKLATEVATTILFLGLGLTLMPRLFRRLHEARWNVLASSSPAGYMLVILGGYVAAATACGVSLVFAAFLAGFAIPRPRGQGSAGPSHSAWGIEIFAFSFPIPVYFALVGWRLDFGKGFSPAMLAIFLALACLVKLASVMVGARAAGFRGLDSVNLAVAMNARGGPGIVLASVAFEAQIINSAFYTTLILTAVLTSQAAGAWLEYVLRRGWPLLSGESPEPVPDGRTEDQPLVPAPAPSPEPVATS